MNLGFDPFTIGEAQALQKAKENMLDPQRSVVSFLNDWAVFRGEQSTAEKLLDKYGKPLLQAFVDYWCEQSINGIKMRYQKEKTFDIDLRLNTWSKNDFDGLWKKHKEDKINKEQEEYYRKNAEKVSEEESKRQKKEMNKITSGMFKKV